MKSKLFFLVLLVASFPLLTHSVLSQNPKAPAGFTQDETQNIASTTINFDDIIFSNVDNSIAIMPNRYAGVIFSAPGTNTWLTHVRYLSYPNSLIVGISSGFPYYDLYSVDSMVIDFTQPAKDVSFWWGLDGTYASGTIEIYNESYQLVNTIPVGLVGSWDGFSLNQFNQRIKRIILRRPAVFDTRYGHIYLENFQFTPITTRSPIGTLESVSTTNNAAIGWSADPDSPSSSNFVDCYIDNQFISRVTANLPGSGAPNPPYTGNHRFSFTIPDAYRNGQNHQVSCTGIDLSGGDPNTVLSGSPKTFNIRPDVISTTFTGFLGQNHNAGGGLRIFPERFTPTGAVNNRVNVKAKISANVAGVPVYFHSYDLDDPYTDSSPIDTNGSAGQDNRATTINGTLCPGGPTGCSVAGGGYRIMTDANGEAVITFELTGAHPGDNYAISATTNVNETPQIVVDGIALRNNVNGQLLLENVARTPMLTAWRTLHIERDSMGIIANEGGTNILNEQVVGVRRVTVSVPTPSPSPYPTPLDPGRFQNGRMVTEGGKFLSIDSNTGTSLTLINRLGKATIHPGYLYKIYDDDDFNSNNATAGFMADHGEDVNALSDTYNLLQENDDTDCSDGLCNVFAAAYIQPDFSWAMPYDTSDVIFQQNVNNIPAQINEQIDRGRNLNSGENDDFWVVYVQIAYQHALDRDCDPNNERCVAGVTGGSIYDVNDVANEGQVPLGASGSLIYIESMRDGNESVTEFRISTVPHEIGHQFGINGDTSDPYPDTGWGLMGYTGGRNFVERHLNVIRWRTSSPHRLGDY